MQITSVKWRAKVLGLSFLVLPSLSNAKEIHNLICKENEAIVVLPQAMKPIIQRSTLVYRFTSDGLSLSSSDRTEYFYNTIRYIEPGRFVSGHKTFIFEHDSLSNAIAVHAHETEIRVSKLSCARV